MCHLVPNTRLIGRLLNLVERYRACKRVPAGEAPCAGRGDYLVLWRRKVGLAEYMTRVCMDFAALDPLLLCRASWTR